MLIYGIKQKTTGKIIYVGQTLNFNRRISEHKGSYRGIKPPQPVHIYMRNYKFEEFEFVVLELVDKQKLLNQKEYYWMGYYNTIEDGFNISTPDAKGKGNANARKVKCITDGKVYDTVTDCAEFYGFKLGELSSHLSKRRYLNGIGKRILDDNYFFEYIGDINPHKIGNQNNKNQGIKIKCLEDGKIYDSIKSAAKYYKINYSVLTEAIKNGKEYCGYNFIKV